MSWPAVLAPLVRQLGPGHDKTYWLAWDVGQMSVYFFEKLRGGLPENRGEIIRITIQYPDFIVDSQRISIERNIEAYFCSWLSAVLSDTDRASRNWG
jgi:hypothetical protein